MPDYLLSPQHPHNPLPWSNLGVHRFIFCIGSSARFCQRDIHVIFERLSKGEPIFFPEAVGGRATGRCEGYSHSGPGPVLAYSKLQAVSMSFLEVLHSFRAHHPVWNLQADPHRWFPDLHYSTLPAAASASNSLKQYSLHLKTPRIGFVFLLISTAAP